MSMCGALVGRARGAGSADIQKIGYGFTWRGLRVLGFSIVSTDAIIPGPKMSYALHRRSDSRLARAPTRRARSRHHSNALIGPALHAQAIWGRMIHHANAVQRVVRVPALKP